MPLQQTNKPNKKKNLKNLNSYLRYSSLAFEMIAILLAFVFGGLKLDQWLETKNHPFTIILSILGVALSLYYALKELIRK